ncbi:MAG: hypothetical protein AAF639_00240 [Chloroflexota bacterium]
MASYTIVDTDIHIEIKRTLILGYLDEPWRTRLADGNRGSGTLGYWNPNGVNRRDAVAEDGEHIYGNPHHLAHLFFDTYNWIHSGEILVCPWHGWEFHLLTGEALADRRRLQHFPVVVENGMVYVEMTVRD